MMQRAQLDILADFPILSRRMGGKRLVYLDNASTTQKPRQVINAISGYYEKYNSNIHRAVYKIAQEATDAYESARDAAAHLVGAGREEVIFVRGTTEAINLIAYTWGRQNIGKGDLIITTEYEHHSNIVPWQILARKTGAELAYVDIDANGELQLEQLDEHLATGRVKLVTFSLVSNVLGTISDAASIISRCKKAGVPTFVDAAQAVPHMGVNFKEMGCDFAAFSGHKMLGPTGIGVLWVRKEILEQMGPFHGGGDMIREVHRFDTTWNDLPYKFEAGTPDISGAIGLGAAIKYLEQIGMDTIRRHESELTRYALDAISRVRGITIYGTNDMAKRGGVISFNFADVHPHDVAQIVDGEGIAIRSGHHCAQVLMEKLDVAATNRASFYLYNTEQDVDALIGALEKVAETFKIGR